MTPLHAEREPRIEEGISARWVAVALLRGQRSIEAVARRQRRPDTLAIDIVRPGRAGSGAGAAAVSRSMPASTARW